MRALVVLVAVVAGLLAVPALAADHTISAPGLTPQSYAQTDVTIDQGDTITFQNLDTAKHDVTSVTTGSDDQPLFKSATIDGGGKTAPVEGVQFLTTGDYPFYCTVHPQSMKGTIHVTANGTPQQRTGTNAPDTTPPAATVAIADSSIRTVLKRRALRVALTSNEPARFKLIAASGRTTVAKGTLTLSRGTKRTGALGLTRAGRKLLAHARRSITLKLRAAVNDAADNRSAAGATRKLRR